MIDFEARFAAYLRAQLREGQLAEDDLAERIEELYAAWEREPQDFLDGKSPAAYFEDWPGDRALSLLRDYYRADIAPPQGLFARIHDDAPLSLLMELLSEEGAPLPLREYAADILTHLRHAPALAFFRKSLLEAPLQEMASRWHHALRQAEAEGALALWALREYPAASREAQRRLLDFFADSGLEEARDYALDWFREEEEDAQLPYAASLLARAAMAGDAEALEALYGRLGEDTGYVAYHEICYAIEALGGVMPDVEPDFSSDDDYQAIAQLRAEEL